MTWCVRMAHVDGTSHVYKSGLTEEQAHRKVRSLNKTYRKYKDPRGEPFYAEEEDTCHE